MIGLIYKIVNKKNRMIYIGQTTRLIDERRDAQIWEVKNSCTKNRLYVALKKYGVSNFKWIIIERNRTRKRMNKREAYWIKTLNATDKLYGYNTHRTGGLKRKKQKSRIYQ